MPPIVGITGSTAKQHATGLGPSTVTLTAAIAVPPKTNNGTYTSTWTSSLVSGR